MVGGLKGAKGLYRWREARRAAALQLGDTEPGVQQAALACLKVHGSQVKVQGERTEMRRELRGCSL